MLFFLLVADNTSMKLSRLPLFVTAKVHSLCTDEQTRDQLHALGIIPGSTITPVMLTPFGTPVIFEVMGTRVALRPEEVAEIVVVELAHENKHVS